MKDYITVNNGMAGYYAVYMAYNREFGAHEPWQTGIGRHKTRAKAEVEARLWAEAEDVEYQP